MSKYHSQGSVTVKDIMASKEKMRKLACVTCYDSAFAKIIDRSSIDLVLVGDSLGNVMLGYDQTISVTMEHMIHHSAAVSRVLRKPLLCGDLPFLSYHLSPEQALANAGRLVQDGGVQCVKVEGGESIIPQVKKIVEAGIPVMGHLGLTPQSVHQMGGYKVQGRGDEAARKLLEDAKMLEQAGIFALVLEMVPKDLAAQCTRLLKIPTIGIGAGPDCDGQILVLHDLLGFDADFQPRFLKKYADLSAIVSNALDLYSNEVRSTLFPGQEHSFTDSKK